jgi:acyl-CoA synthetase (AMP-forming)/AMP-acid ligase II
MTAINPVWGALDRPDDGRPHLHCWDVARYRPVGWDEWRRGSERSAAGLQALGVRPGDRVAAVLTNTADVCNAILGAWLAGATLMSLPTPRRGMPPDQYVEQLQDICARTEDVRVLLLEDRFTGLLDSTSFGTPVASFASLDRDLKPTLHPLSDEDPAFVQFSSGSTGHPKGILLSMAAIGRQELMLADRLQVDGTSQGLMWLPLSHDMGLFGCLMLSWVAGMRLAIGPPERFLQRPQTWFDDAADFGATITVSPNFGLALATRRAATTPPKGSFPLRSLVLGGERIEPSTIEAAHETLGPFGVTRETLTPAYGLAEGTLAVTMKNYGEEPGSVWIDRERAYHGELCLLDEADEGAVRTVSCGPPMRGVSVRAEGGDLGRIRVRSDSLAGGYLDAPEATAEAFVDGEFRTGDLGFLHGGELIVLGRTDDVLVISGRNVHARDVEGEIERHGGIRPGCSALIDCGEAGRSRVVLVAEPTGTDPALDRLADDVAELAFRAAGLRVSECVFVRPGNLPKTPSGKIQRFLCRQLIEADDSEAMLERVPT